MDKIIILPDIAEAEVRIKVPPRVQKQSLWSGIVKKIGSLFKKKETTHHNNDYQKMGDLPIYIIGCDIKRIQNIFIAPENERRD